MKLFAAAALLPGGWADDVLIDIGADGSVAQCRRERDARTAPSARAGPLVPGMPNLHSHAFQRALAGRTGRAPVREGDSFWTWRQAMYAFLDRVDADAFEAIAAQAYVEMLKAGYTAVARISLRASRSRRQRVRGPGRARAARDRRGSATPASR